jgi:acyl-CoA hydrolase
METKPSACDTLTMAHVMSPEMANFSGNIHGGHILHLLDQTAYACAARYSRTQIVTVSVDNVLFKKPIYVGELVTFHASINFVGRTSMEVGIRVEAENLSTGEVRHTMTCYFSMVAVDKDMHPTPVAPLLLETDDQKRRFEDAKERKALRTKMQADHEARKS